MDVRTVETTLCYNCYSYRGPRSLCGSSRYNFKLFDLDSSITVRTSGGEALTPCPQTLFFENGKLFDPE